MFEPNLTYRALHNYNIVKSVAVGDMYVVTHNMHELSLCNIIISHKIYVADIVIRHSRLPAGNALWFCQIFFFILPPPRFPDDNF